MFLLVREISFVGNETTEITNGLFAFWCHDKNDTHIHKAHGLNRLKVWWIRFADPLKQVSGSSWLIHF